MSPQGEPSFVVIADDDPVSGATAWRDTPRSDRANLFAPSTRPGPEGAPGRKRCVASAESVIVGADHVFTLFPVHDRALDPLVRLGLHDEPLLCLGGPP